MPLATFVGVFNPPSASARQLARRQEDNGLAVMSEAICDSCAAHHRSLFRLTSPSWLLFVLAVAATVLCVRSGLWQMLASLLSPEFSQGLILPFVAAFLVWQRRDQMERMPFTGSWSGLLIVVLGAALAVLGALSTVFTLEHYAALLMFCGLVLAWTGWRAFRQLWVAMLVLFFMVPPPQFLYQNLSMQLQLLSSQIGVGFMRLLGVTVFLEGNVIDLGVYQFQVAEACDGLRYLFPLVTISFLMAYFFKTALWKRMVVFLSSIPLAVLMNSVRVGMIGVLVQHWGARMAEGFLHAFQGWLVFMMSGGLLLLEVMLLARIGPKGKPWREQFRLDLQRSPPRTVRAMPRPLPVTLYLSAALLIVFGTVSVLLPERAEFVPRRVSFGRYPNVIGEWQGRRETLDPAYRDALMLDDYLLADFTRKADPPINFYVAWYDSQRAGRSAHSPYSCLPAGGWEIKSLTRRELPGARPGGEALRVNRVLIQSGRRRQLVYYWFQQRGRLVTNEYAAKWYLFWDALTRNRTDGALVRLVVPLEPGGADADRQLTEFAAAAASTLPPFVPD